MNNQLNYLQKLLHLSAEQAEGTTVQWKTLEEVAVIGTGSHDTQDAIKDVSYTFYARGIAPLKLNCFDFDETAIITAGDGVGVGKVFHWAVGKYALQSFLSSPTHTTPIAVQPSLKRLLEAQKDRE